MKRILGYLILFIAGIIVQFGWSQYLSLSGVSPNFILIALIFVGLESGSFSALILGFFWGLAWDAISIDLFGIHAFLFTTIGYMSGKLNKKWNEDKVVNQVILTFSATLFYWLGIFSLFQIFGPSEYKFRLNYIIIIQPFYNMLIAPIIFWLGERLLDAFDVQSESY